MSLNNLTKLLNQSSNLIDKLIVSLLADTSLHLSDLANIEMTDIDFQHQTIVVWGKGVRQRRVAYGEVSDGTIRDYMYEWGMGEKLFELLPRGVAQDIETSWGGNGNYL